jgi:hypothetical protein
MSTLFNSFGKLYLGFVLVLWLGTVLVVLPDHDLQIVV